MKIVINESQHKFLISELKYTDDDIRQEASKYQTSKEFQQNNPSGWQMAHRRKILDNLFPNRKIGRGRDVKYTDDDIRQEASKYQTSKEFQQNNPSGWQTAYNRKMLDDLFTNRKIGRGGTIQYTDDDIRQEASKYQTSKEFQQNNPSGWQMAYKRKMLDDLFPDRKKNNSYTDDDIRREASKYQTSAEFLQNNPSMWQMAYRRKILDNLFPNRKIGRGRDVKYTDDDIRREASKYQTSAEFLQNNPSMWQMAYKRKMLNDLFPNKKIGRGRDVKYTDDDIRREASKYQTSKEFHQNNPSGWQMAYKRKMLNDLFTNRKIGKGRDVKYTDDDIRQEASKYNSQNEFMKGSPKMFGVASNRKMLDNLFPDRIKRQNRM